MTFPNPNCQVQTRKENKEGIMYISTDKNVGKLYFGLSMQFNPLKRNRSTILSDSLFVCLSIYIL